LKRNQDVGFAHSPLFNAQSQTGAFVILLRYVNSQIHSCAKKTIIQVFDSGKDQQLSFSI
jgi:hypothetical protein